MFKWKLYLRDTGLGGARGACLAQAHMQQAGEFLPGDGVDGDFLPVEDELQWHGKYYTFWMNS